MTRIALCLDDLGLHAGVNAAAAALARMGRLNAVSCMVGAAHWRGAGEALAAKPDASILIAAGLVVGNMPTRHLGQIAEFKEQLTDLLVATLFVLPAIYGALLRRDERPAEPTAS